MAKRILYERGMVRATVWMRAAGAVGLLFLITGCFSERSFPMVPGRMVRVTSAEVEADRQRVGTRAWVERVHPAVARRLPEGEMRALTTEGLSNGAQIVDVWKVMGLEAGTVDSLWGNLEGIEQTAQVASPPPQIEKGHIQRGAWQGFSDVEVPVGGGRLFGRLGVPEAADEIPGSFVVITHGLFGSLDGLDMENHVQALRRAGHHVLAIEMRGHGETNCLHPEYAITFGVEESGDLVATARWLKETHGAQRVGLVSFSLTGYEALLTAWVDGASPVRATHGGMLLSRLPLPGAEVAFNGGMFVVSAPVGIVNLADRFEPRVGKLDAPCKSTFQDHVAARLAAYGEPEAFGMWALAKSELVRGGYLKDPTGEAALRKELLDFIDLSRDGWRVGAERMENVRGPVLLLSAANDPLGTAQGVAELFGRVRNPNIGVVLLKEGGHMGFSALSADYYYSLMLNFFDPRTAPATVRVAPGGLNAQASEAGANRNL